MSVSHIPTGRRRRTRWGAFAGVTTLALIASPLAGVASAVDPAVPDFTRGGLLERSAPATPEQLAAPHERNGDFGGADALQRLDGSRTLVHRPDGTLAARQPKLVGRKGSLWLSPEGSPLPEQNLSSIDLAQNVPGKRITVTAPYAAVPTEARNSALYVYFGTWDAKEEVCTGKAWVAGIAASTSTDNAAAGYMDGSSAGTATRTLSGSTLTLTWTGGGAGSTAYACAYAKSHPVNGSTIGTDVLESSSARDFDAVYEKAPAFELYSSDLNAAYPGKWNKVYVSIRNDGDATASNVKVRAAGAKIKLRKKTVSLGSLAPGKRKSVNLQVKLRGKATRKLNLKVTAQGNWSANSRTKVGFKPRPKKVKKLVGRTYWASPTKIYTGWNVSQLTFVNRKWVYQGVPKAGLPKCSAKVKACSKYKYNARKGKLKIGKTRAKVDSEGVRTTGKTKIFYTPLQRPKANLRTSAQLSYYDYNGCEGSYSCSTWWRHLTLNKNGTFRWTYEAIHSSGMPPNQIFVSVSRPTKVGKYQFLSKHRIRFTYPDPETGKSTSELFTVGIDSDVLGRFSPSKGLLIGAMPHSP